MQNQTCVHGAQLAAQIITPYNVYFNSKLIMKGEVWRLLTNFFFFGNLGAMLAGASGVPQQGLQHLQGQCRVLGCMAQGGCMACTEPLIWWPC